MPVSYNQENMRDCFCPDCPTYAGAEAALYCSAGYSKQQLRTNGCLCPQCPVYENNGLNSTYFCVLEKAQLEQPE
ncbi:MAG: DUF2769 domain-containing protein [Actinobacteria bacterium]|nr:MAG: DUF2769 domain-containing protein [Actinomycetota bacterium]